MQTPREAATEVELVLDACAAVGEGAVWDDVRGELVWVDIPAGTMHRLTPRTGRDEQVQAGMPVGAVAMRTGGGYVLALRDGFGVLDPAGETVQLVCAVEAERRENRMNDGKCDSAGRFWAGTMAADMSPGAGTLYRLDPDLRVTPVLGGLNVSNGMGWSPDDRTMYLIDSGAHCVDMFDFDAGTGSVNRRRRLIDIPASDGLPDGMTVDAEGCLWIAMWGGWEVRCYSPDGTLRTQVALPVSQVSSCIFGGDALDDLYVTSARAGLTPADLAREPHAGGVFRVMSAGRGTPARRFGG